MKIPFQFSIRELFLLTLSVAALLALARTYWKQSEHIQGTELTNQHFIPPEVDKFAKELGLSGRLSYSGGGSGAGGSDINRRGRSGAYSFDLPLEFHEEIVSRLRQSIEDKIISGGCRIVGRGSGVGGDEWVYSRESFEGVTKLSTVSPGGKENKLYVMFLVIEHSQPKR